MSSTNLTQASQDADRAEQAADRAEQALKRQRRESNAAKGIAPKVDAIPTEAVRLSKRFGERQREALAEFMEFLPLIEIVAALPEVPPVEQRFEMTEEQIERMMNHRLTELLKAGRLVVDRVRKEI